MKDEKQNNKKSQIAGIIVGIICFALAFWGAQQLFKPSLEKELSKMAEEINKKTPVNYGETQLDSVKAGTREIIYYYTLVYDFDELDPESIKANIEPAIIEGVSTNNEMGGLRNKNVTFSYIYYSKDGKKAYEINVTPEIYNKKIK